MKKKRIAVFANGWSNEYLEQVLEGLRNEAKKDGVDIFVFFTYSSWGDSFNYCKSQLNIFHLPKPTDFDGAIMLTNTFNFPDEEERVCALFKDKGIPLISTGVKVEGIPFFGTSNYEGMFELASHLIEVHKAQRIVYVSGISGNAENAERNRALVDALHEHGLELFDTIEGDYSFYGGYNGVDAWLDNHDMPDAFVCANDHTAIGVCSLLSDRGYVVPEDVLVTGFDNILSAQVNVPMIATVASPISEWGRDLYLEIKNQIENPNPSLERIYPSSFIPAKSCGCEPSSEQIAFRRKKLQRRYYEKAYDDLKTMFYQNMRFALAKVESKEEFFEAAKEPFEELKPIGKDYSICIEPDFLNLNDEQYPKRRRGYSHNMDVIYHKENGEPISPFSFDSKNLVPYKKKSEDESNIYFIVPLYNMDYVIGYAVVKNSPEMIYDLSFRSWVMNMNTLFVNIRQYIFAQESNRKLKEIYMSDFLTGMYNRNGCENVLYENIKKNMAEGLSSLLLFVDINRMKVINDKHGHLNGDLAIKATADALRTSLSDEWLFGRYGGDELIAVGLLTDDCDAEALCSKLRSSMKEYTDKLNLSFALSSSIGYTIIRPDTNGEIEDFIQKADDSMYEEKQLAHKLIDNEG